MTTAALLLVWRGPQRRALTDLREQVCTTQRAV